MRYNLSFITKIVFFVMLLLPMQMVASTLFFHITVGAIGDSTEKEIEFCFKNDIDDKNPSTRKVISLWVERHVAGTENTWVKVWQVDGPFKASCLKYGQSMENTVITPVPLLLNIRYRVIAIAKTIAFWGPKEDEGCTEFKFDGNSNLIVAKRYYTVND